MHIFTFPHPMTALTIFLIIILIAEFVRCWLCWCDYYCIIHDEIPTDSEITNTIINILYAAVLVSFINIIISIIIYH